MALKFVLMPPQTDRTRQWAAQIMDSLPDYSVVAPESEDEARRELPDADAAFGTIPPDLLAIAQDLR